MRSVGTGLLEGLFTPDPGIKPGAYVSSTGNRGDVIKVFEYPEFRQHLDNAEAKGRTADAATRYGQAQEIPVLVPMNPKFLAASFNFGFLGSGYRMEACRALNVRLGLRRSSL